MSAVCPNGHASQAEDYCDTCGAPIDASVTSAGAAPAAAGPGSRPGPAEAGSAAQVGSAGQSGSAAQAGSAAQPGAGGQSGSAGQPASSGGEDANGSGLSGIPGGGRSSLDLDAPAPEGAEREGAAPEGAAPEGAAPEGAAPGSLECPNCHTENPEGALFCEACGYDFTTGAMPRTSAAEAASAALGNKTGAAEAAETDESEVEQGEPFEWVAEVWVDPDWYATQDPEDPCPSPGLPTIIPLRHRSLLLGRVSSSRRTSPEIDLSTDPAVSRRHAQLTTDGSRWFVEDLDSSNGTFVGPASGPLPEQPIQVGPKRELDDDDRLYVGAWTRIVVRRATPDEIDTFG